MRPRPAPTDRRSAASPPGFTLTELLVVILIIVILSAATLPAVLPALNSRRVSEGARVLQSEIARARDSAVRANAPRGFRLLPDPEDLSRPAALTASRLVSLEVPPEYAEGELYLGHGPSINPPYYGPQPGQEFPIAGNLTARPVDVYLRVVERKFVVDSAGLSLPANPTSWYWNLRQGDKLRLNDSGRVYTVAGPVLINGDPTASTGNPNPERFINYGQPNGAYPTGPGTPNAEFLYLLNGIDDDGDGFVDEQFDGVDNDGDGIVDPGFNGIDDDAVNGIDDVAEMFLHRNPNGSFSYPGYTYGGVPLPAVVVNAGKMNEFEFETFVGKLPPIPSSVVPIVLPTPLRYSVQRRPMPTSSSREVSLPTNVVIDLTTTLTPSGQLNALSERSRVPIDPKTGYVDVLIAPNGQVLASAAGTNLAPPIYLPFYHFWITERDDVFEPFAASQGLPFQLPMPRGSGLDSRISTGTAYADTLPGLKSERRLLSINTRTGQITSTAIELFYANNPSYPFEAAESGVKDALP